MKLVELYGLDPNSDAGGEFDDELAPAVVTVQDLMQE
jgi:hypothetical protein